MKIKVKTILKIVIVIVMILIAYVIYYEISKVNKDALTFKQEYESLNDTKPKKVYIPENNPIKYINPTEAIKIIKNKKGIIYFGANWCPWCRQEVESLIEAAFKTNTKTVYYVKMDEYNNLWEFKDDQLVKTKEEKDKYYELLEVLKNELKDYVVKDQNGEDHNVGEKRIYLPFTIAVNNGKVVYRKKEVENPTGEEIRTKEQDLTEYIDLMNSIKN